MTPWATPAIGSSSGVSQCGSRPATTSPATRGGVHVALHDDLAAAGGAQRRGRRRGRPARRSGSAQVRAAAQASAAPARGRSRKSAGRARSAPARASSSGSAAGAEEAPCRRRVTAAVGESQAAKGIAAGGTRGGGRMRATRRGRQQLCHLGSEEHQLCLLADRVRKRSRRQTSRASAPPWTSALGVNRTTPAGSHGPSDRLRQGSREVDDATVDTRALAALLAGAALALAACGGDDRRRRRARRGAGRSSTRGRAGAPTLERGARREGHVTFCAGKDTTGGYAHAVERFNERYARPGPEGGAARVPRGLRRPARAGRPAAGGALARVRRLPGRHHLDRRVRPAEAGRWT